MIKRTYKDAKSRTGVKIAVVEIRDTSIIKPVSTKEVVEVHIVGKIDRKIYKCITEEIVTDEVIITDERIEHIIERRGQEFYDKCCINRQSKL